MKAEELYVGNNGVLIMKYSGPFHKPIHGVNDKGFYTDPSWVDSFEGFRLNRRPYNMPINCRCKWEPKPGSDETDQGNNG